MINPQMIKKALVRLAQFQERPPYEPCAVRYIIANFETHPLREAILYFCELDPVEHSTRYVDLLSVCGNKAMIDLVCRITGIDVKPILEGKQNITHATWMVLQKHFDVIEDISVTQVKLKEDFEYEAGFDLFLSALVQDSEYDWHTMTYNDDELNEAWLSFQDFRSEK